MKKKRKKKITPVRTEDELQKILFIQRTVTQAAKNEMLAMAMDLRDPEKYIQAGKKLLAKYAEYPTLSEFAANPKLSNVYKWGATFGVAALVGGLVIENVKVMQPRFAPALRKIFFLLLKELDQPTHKYLIDPIIETLGMHVVVEGADATSLRFGDSREEYLRHAMSRVVETFVLVGSQYGLMAASKKRVALTPTGKRVLMHLVDIARFIEEMGLASTELQTKKQKP